MAKQEWHKRTLNRSPEEKKQLAKGYREAHKEQIDEYRKEYVKHNKEKINEYAKRHPEAVLERNRRYREAHREKIREANRKAAKARYYATKEKLQRLERLEAQLKAENEAGESDADRLLRELKEIE